MSKHDDKRMGWEVARDLERELALARLAETLLPLLSDDEEEASDDDEKKKKDED